MCLSNVLWSSIVYGTTLQSQARFCNNKSLYVNYDILPVRMQYNLSIFKLIFKCLYYDGPMSNITKGIFALSAPNHAYATRMSLTNYLTTGANAPCFKSLVFNCTRIWNRIPLDIRNAAPISSFVRMYKNHLMDGW